jgi:hypothetical protein
MGSRGWVRGGHLRVAGKGGKSGAQMACSGFLVRGNAYKGVGIYRKNCWQDLSTICTLILSVKQIYQSIPIGNLLS